MLDLIVLEHLVDGIDRAAVHAGGVELPDPGVGGFLFSERADLGVERVAVLGAGRRCGVFGAAWKVGRTDRLGTALPDPSARRGDVDVAVGSLEHAGRNAGRMV